MKQRAHAWVALSAFKLMDERGAAPKLVELLAYYLSDVWDGAWLPDTLIRDMGYGHIYKMAGQNLLGSSFSGEPRFRVRYAELKKELRGERHCLEYAKDCPELDSTYHSDPKHGGHLPNRVIALSHTISDMLKMGDYPIAFYARGVKPKAYQNTLSREKTKGLSLSPNFSARQIALMFFVMSHYICDAHMPLHCDLRDTSPHTPPRLPEDLHASIEAAWEGYFPDKDTVMLHDYSPRSVTDIVDRLPKKSPIRVGSQQCPLGDIDAIDGDEWEEMVRICRVSYAVSRHWVGACDCESAEELIQAVGQEQWQNVTNCIFADAVSAVARLWHKAWDRFIGSGAET